MNYKSFLYVETYEIITATHNRIFFEILIQEFDAICDYTFREALKLNIFNINIIQSEYGIRFYQTDHTTKNIIQEYWGTKKKYDVNYHKSLSPVGTSFEKTLLVYIPLIGEDMK